MGSGALVKTLPLARVTGSWGNCHQVEVLRFSIHDDSTVSPDGGERPTSRALRESTCSSSHSPPPELEGAKRKLTRASCLGVRGWCLWIVDAEP